MFRPLAVLWLVACSAPELGALATEPTDKAAAIVGDWESLDRHIAMGSLYQLEHGVRKREGVVRFSLEGDRLTGMAMHADHAAITRQEHWDGTTTLNKVSFDGKKLSFEWEIGEWFHPACAIDVEDCRLPNKGTVRVEAELRGIRLIGKWGMFLSDGNEAFRGEWEAVRANGANVISEGAATIMLIGGSHQDLTDNLRSAFFLRAGGPKAKIVVIPTAIKNADDPETDTLLDEWRKLKPLSVELLHTRDRTKANDPAFVKPLTEATAVFFTNGHRDRILDAYRDTLVQQELKNLWARGGLIGGTGTGAVVLGSLVSERAEMGSTEPGLDVVSGFMIEDRDEPERFSAAIAAHPNHIGVDVGPATAVVIRGRRLRVLGESTATIRLAPADKIAARVEVLTAGGELDIAELQSSAVERSKPPAKQGANAPKRR